MLEMIFEVVLKVEVAEMRFNSRAAQVCQVAPEENEAIWSGFRTWPLSKSRTSLKSTKLQLVMFFYTPFYLKTPSF